MRKKALLGCLLAVVVFLQTEISSLGQECRIVRIFGGVPQHEVGVRLEPDTLWISKGTCVIWNNVMRTDEIKVVFEEGKICQEKSEAPSGFKLDENNCYASVWIPFGGTASLMFREKGTFEYMIDARGGKKEKGQIIVHD